MVTLVMFMVCTALSVGCLEVVTTQEYQEKGQTAAKTSAEIGGPNELAPGIWSITIDVHVSTHDQQFLRLTGDESGRRSTSILLTTYQRAFGNELQRALDAVLRRNMHCTISALSVLHARQVWLGGDNGGPMALPSGAIVVLPCGGNEPLAKPDKLPAK